MDCVFCDIASGKVEVKILHRDDRIIAIHDINPQAPLHILLLPIEHLKSIRDINSSNASLLTHMTLTATKLAKEAGIFEKGYRVVINCGKEGGQTVYHLHMHLLGGRQLSGNLG